MSSPTFDNAFIQWFSDEVQTIPHYRGFKYEGTLDVKPFQGRDVAYYTYYDPNIGYTTKMTEKTSRFQAITYGEGDYSRRQLRWSSFIDGAALDPVEVLRMGQGSAIGSDAAMRELARLRTRYANQKNTVVRDAFFGTAFTGDSEQGHVTETFDTTNNRVLVNLSTGVFGQTARALTLDKLYRGMEIMATDYFVPYEELSTIFVACSLKQLNKLRATKSGSDFLLLDKDLKPVQSLGDTAGGLNPQMRYRLENFVFIIDDYWNPVTVNGEGSTAAYGIPMWVPKGLMFTESGFMTKVDPNRSGYSPGTMTVDVGCHMGASRGLKNYVVQIQVDDDETA